MKLHAFNALLDPACSASRGQRTSCWAACRLQVAVASLQLSAMHPVGHMELSSLQALRAAPAKWTSADQASCSCTPLMQCCTRCWAGRGHRRLLAGMLSRAACSVLPCRQSVHRWTWHCLQVRSRAFTTVFGIVEPYGVDLLHGAMHQMVLSSLQATGLAGACHATQLARARSALSAAHTTTGSMSHVELCWICNRARLCHTVHRPEGCLLQGMSFQF